MSLTTLLAGERRTASIEGTRPLTSASLLDILGGGQSATGKRVSEEGALRLGVVYTCTLIIADGVASLPLPVYKRLGDREKERAVDHPAYPLLNRRPNPWMNSLTLRQTLQGHLCLWGNAFAEIMRDSNGRLTGLFPLRPDRMERPKLAASGDLLYRYTLPSGERKDLPSSRVLHLRGLSSDGLWGYSPVGLQREAIALGLTMEEFAGRLFTNMANPSGVLEVKGKLSPEGAARLATSWQARHGGLENAHRVAVLEEGVEWKQIGMPLDDAQFLEERKFERSEIAGWYRVPPHMIGDTDKATSWGTGIEAQTLGFVTFTLRPWLVNWEQELSINLLTEPEQRVYFIEHLIEGLLRGDTTARGEFYVKMADRGVFSINDIRSLENMNPVEGGDERFVQANMVPLSMAGEQFKKEPASDDQVSGGDGSGGDDRSGTGDDGGVGFGRLESRAQDPRAHLREVYRPLFRDAAERVVEREGAAIREHGLPRLDQRDAASFESWLEQFYRDDLGPFILRIVTPLLTAYGAATEREVLAELDIPALSESLEPFIERYAESMARSYTGRSQGQLNEVARKALADQADVRQAIEQRLREWLEKRPDKIADIESVRAGEAVAHTTYRRAGVRRLVWKLGAARSGKHCPFCTRLNGKTVGIDESFLHDGDELEGEEGQPKMKIRGNRAHAPAHSTCRCHVAPA